MNKKKISKQQGATWKEIEEVDYDISPIKGEKVNPKDFFKDHAKVGPALLQCLLENDTDAFIEILDEYLHVNRSRVAKNANLARSTV